MEEGWYEYTGEEDPPADARNIRVAPHVTALRDEAFARRRKLRRVDLANVTIIGLGAFADCQNLRGVNLYEGLLEIGEEAFAGCGLHSIAIPSTVATIGELAFDGSGLQSISIPSTVTALGNGAFRDCDKLTSVDLPDGLPTICEGAFRGCSRLAHITIPSTVTTIGKYAFLDCDKLASVELPEGLQTIGEGAFWNSGLTQISIPSTVTTIGRHAFRKCNTLTLVSVELCEGGVLDNIGEEAAFYGCTLLATVVLSEGIQTIPKRTFSHCYELSKISIPSTVEEISKGAFRRCYNLAEAELSEGLQMIGEGAFLGCSRLQRITIPSTVTEIGRFAFLETPLKSVELLEGLQTIGEGAFAWSRLKRIVIPSTVTKIGRGAFDSCEKLNNVKLPEGVLEIDGGAFGHCSELQSLTIPSPAFVIARSDAGNEDVLGCQLSMDASIGRGSVRMVASKSVRWLMASGYLEEVEGKITGIIARQEQSVGDRLERVRKLFAYYDLLDATSVLELAIWKARIEQAPRRSRRKRARVDPTLHREQCRTDSGAHVILPLVMTYF